MKTSHMPKDNLDRYFHDLFEWFLIPKARASGIPMTPTLLLDAWTRLRGLDRLEIEHIAGRPLPCDFKSFKRSFKSRSGMSFNRHESVSTSERKVPLSRAFADLERETRPVGPSVSNQEHVRDAEKRALDSHHEAIRWATKAGAHLADKESAESERDAFRANRDAAVARANAAEAERDQLAKRLAAAEAERDEAKSRALPKTHEAVVLPADEFASYPPRKSPKLEGADEPSARGILMKAILLAMHPLPHAGSDFEHTQSCLKDLSDDDLDRIYACIRLAVQYGINPHALRPPGFVSSKYFTAENFSGVVSRVIDSCGTSGSTFTISFAPSEPSEDSAAGDDEVSDPNARSDFRRSLRRLEVAARKFGSPQPLTEVAKLATRMTVSDIGDAFDQINERLLEVNNARIDMPEMVAEAGRLRSGLLSLAAIATRTVVDLEMDPPGPLPF